MVCYYYVDSSQLTWRDVQYLSVLSASAQSLNADDWVTNGAGHKVSHHFGFGMMDASRMVDFAANWTNLPEQNICEVSSPDRNRFVIILAQDCEVSHEFSNLVSKSNTQEFTWYWHYKYFGNFVVVLCRPTSLLLLHPVGFDDGNNINCCVLFAAGSSLQKRLWYWSCPHLAVRDRIKKSSIWSMFRLRLHYLAHGEGIFRCGSHHPQELGLIF